MSFSLSAIATALSVVAGAVQATEIIYKAGAELIVVAENAYSASVGSGATKKAAVLQALQAFCVSVGQNWALLKDELSSWVDMVVQSWNTLKALSHSESATAAVASADQVATVSGTATPVAPAVAG
ncbi:MULTISPECIES: hypothetical protein [Pantoea]|jgi:hypothetical protein|uniref:Uncharacterized protein n=1 Tax=Pantoea brenneri TaxID=472694 RepID=A0A7Y6NH55_9GAMM|nr:MULTISPECIES: hypothetical protein [Pantoea]MBZ6397049.1 hypothetical protein [Pantoea sp.]MBZ6440200.1 hypothetical protein [Pantoea sp.]NUY43438.1 hypothetical protein [Pantoea brenneri]NUY50996.1 hypothetical protein [Pantoea brenneri]NUY61273.1 hypothetical protein [Pantoea brenneri]